MCRTEGNTQKQYKKSNGRSGTQLQVFLKEPAARQREPGEDGEGELWWQGGMGEPGMPMPEGNCRTALIVLRHGRR